MRADLYGCRAALGEGGMECWKWRGGDGWVYISLGVQLRWRGARMHIRSEGDEE